MFRIRTPTAVKVPFQRLGWSFCPNHFSGSDKIRIQVDFCSSHNACCNWLNIFHLSVNGMDNGIANRIANRIANCIANRMANRIPNLKSQLPLNRLGC
jgi:hypothetical protein